MTKEQIGGIVRTLAASALAYAAGKGLIGPEMVNELSAAISTIFVAAWSVIAKRA